MQMRWKNVKSVQIFLDEQKKTRYGIEANMLTIEHLFHNLYSE